MIVTAMPLMFQLDVSQLVAVMSLGLCAAMVYDRPEVIAGGSVTIEEAGIGRCPKFGAGQTGRKFGPDAGEVIDVSESSDEPIELCCLIKRRSPFKHPPATDGHTTDRRASHHP
jgi:hypothetical protein